MLANTYERMWGDAPTCSTDPLALLEVLPDLLDRLLEAEDSGYL